MVNGHGMFKFVRKYSQPIGDHPLTDTLFLHIAWKYKPSQLGTSYFWSCPLRVVLSGKQPHNFRKSPFLMCKSTSSMTIFFLYVYRRVSHFVRHSCLLFQRTTSHCIPMTSQLNSPLSPLPSGKHTKNY